MLADINIWCLLGQILFFVFLYILSYFLYNKCFNKIIRIYNKRKHHSNDKNMEQIIQIQKDFDNIACDSILVANAYKNEFDKLTTNEKKIKALYYFEVMHYLNTACEKTLELVENKKECIRTLEEASGVDLFRVINISEIMEELKNFLKVYYEDTCGTSTEQEAIKIQILKLEKNLNFIRNNL